MSRLTLGLFVALLAIAMPGTAGAEEGGVTLRRGEHARYTRLVFVLPEPVAFAMSRDGTTVTLGFAGAGLVPGSRAGGRLQSVVGGAGAVSITPQPGKSCHVWQIGSRVIVDVSDAPSDAPPAHPAPRPAAEDAGGTTQATVPAPAATVVPVVLPAAAKKWIIGAASLPRARPRPSLPVIRPGAVAAAPVPVLAVPVLAVPVLETPLPSPPSATVAAGAPPPVLPPPPESPAIPPVLQARQAPVDAGFAAALLPADGDFPNGAVLLPFGADVGAASFRRGGEGHVVFDTAQTIDLGVLRNDPTYGGMAVEPLPAGTHLHLVLAASAQLRLSRGADGWRVGIVPAQPGRPPITARAEQGVLKLLAASPGRTIVLEDRATGGRLMAGTQRGDGQPWLAPYASAEFALLPTWQGVLVQPASDRAALRVVDGGFSLGADGNPPLSVPVAQNSAQDGAGSVVMTRRFDLPPVNDALWRGRLQLAWQDAAAAPKLGRFGPRLRAAQAMVALGLDAEAGTMLKAAQADDPARADDLDVAALSAMTDWLAGRADPAEIARLDDPGLTGTDEITLWRALVHGKAPDPAPQGAAVATTWKLALTYPAQLRQALLSPMAAILARAGKTDALRELLKAFPDRQLDVDRAALLAADGKTTEALAAYGRIAASPDRQQSARARRAATELALASHRIDAPAAARQLAQQLYAWRGGDRDIDLRMRLAALQGQTGQWREGLALLRETEPLFPEQHDRLHTAERGLVTDLVKGAAADRMAPLDLVALAEECAGLLAEDGADAKLAPVLASKLEALDLPDRAEPVLQHILDRTGDPAAKAEVGLRLAELRLDLRGAKAALATLDASEAPALPAALAAGRALLRARALAASGNADSALHLLDSQATAPAAELRARLLEQKHDWPAAEAALSAYAALTLPASGTLTTAQQNLVVHLASLAEQAGDAAALQRLKAQQGNRLSAGPAAELFQLLVETPVHGVDDLTRAGQELKLARATPAALARLRDR